MNQIETEHIPLMFEEIAKVMTDNSELLCSMDANMGDGDLGLTMKKGFSALPDIFKSLEDEKDLGKRIAKTGLKMTSVVPSTMGTLMGSGIMEGGKSIAGLDKIDSSGYVSYLKGMANGIAKRGKCSKGDRTVLDSILAASLEADELLSKKPESSLLEVAKSALEGAKKGLEATKTMTPKYGKAVVFASKAVGIEDQGAFAAKLLIEAIYNFIKEN